MQLTDSQRWLIFATVLATAGLVVALAPILSPFVTALLLAYISNPLIDQLQRLKLSRMQSVVLTFLLLTLVLAALAFLLLPMLLSQVDQLIQLIPRIYGWLKEVAAPYLEAQLGIELIELDWLQLGQQVDWGATGDIVRSLMVNLTTSSFAVISLLGNLVLIPVVTFYLLRDWQSLLARVADLIPRYYVNAVTSVVRECHETLGAFLRGQLLVMLAQAVIYALGLTLVGLDLGLLIGILAGLASIVPYLGSIFGIGAGLAAAFFQFGDLFSLLLVIAVFAVGQTLEAIFLTPKLVGDRIGLHPVAVIFAVLAGGQLFGFVGVLLALPTTAVIMVLVRRADRNYRHSALYRPNASDAPLAQPEREDDR